MVASIPDLLYMGRLRLRYVALGWLDALLAVGFGVKRRHVWAGRGCCGNHECPLDVSDFETSR
jgi:hypothetical protein